IVRFIYAWCQDWTSVGYCEEKLGMCPKACSDWCGHLREVCAWRICQQAEKQIGGPGTTVEVDEALFSRRKNHAGRIPPGKRTFGGVCREDTTQSFAVCVPDRTAATLLPIVRRWIKPGTRIVSDGWRAYKELANDPDYSWSWKDNDDPDFVDRDDRTIHTQTLESMWRPLKQVRRRRNSSRIVDNESYLSEGLWRMRVDAAGKDPFEAIVEDIKHYWPPGTPAGTMTFYENVKRELDV
ncbi:hypothetical protein AAVH_41593, partial [Aphelenchoides avenae]